MNIDEVKQFLGRKVSGASLDDIEGIGDFSLFKEAAVNVLTEIMPAETVRHNTLEVFNDIYDYGPPADFRGLADIRPQSLSRDESDNATRRYLESFDQNKNLGEFTEEWADGDKLLRYVRPITTPGNLGIHTMDSLATNGTWDGTASNIALSTRDPYKGSGSISADYDTGEYIENDDMTAIDLSEHENKSTLFLAGFFPGSSFITNIDLQWGNDVDSNFFNRTVTAPQFGSFKDGWNVIPFAWNGATETGTVDTTKIDSIRVTIALSTSDTDIRIDNIFSALGEVRDIIYYSNFLFRTSAGVWIETPTDDTDIVNLDTDAHNLFLYECARIATLQLQGNSDLYKTYTSMLYNEPDEHSDEPSMYARYKERTPEEEIRAQTQYRTIGYTKK